MKEFYMEGFIYIVVNKNVFVCDVFCLKKFMFLCFRLKEKLGWKYEQFFYRKLIVYGF